MDASGLVLKWFSQLVMVQKPVQNCAGVSWDAKWFSIGFNAAPTTQHVAEVHTLNKLFCGATACLRALKDLPYFPNEYMSALFKGERTLTQSNLV